MVMMLLMLLVVSGLHSTSNGAAPTGAKATVTATTSATASDETGGAITGRCTIDRLLPHCGRFDRFRSSGRFVLALLMVGRTGTVVVQIGVAYLFGALEIDFQLRFGARRWQRIIVRDDHLLVVIGDTASLPTTTIATLVHLLVSDGNVHLIVVLLDVLHSSLTIDRHRLGFRVVIVAGGDGECGTTVLIPASTAEVVEVGGIIMPAVSDASSVVLYGATVSGMMSFDDPPPGAISSDGVLGLFSSNESLPSNESIRPRLLPAAGAPVDDPPPPAAPSFADEDDLRRSFEHHFHSGCALKWASLTSLASSWYLVFSSGFSAYHHSPRILLTVRLSWFGCFWCTSARWRLEKIMNAFIGRRIFASFLFRGLCGSFGVPPPLAPPPEGPPVAPFATAAACRAALHDCVRRFAIDSALSAASLPATLGASMSRPRTNMSSGGGGGGVYSFFAEAATTFAAAEDDDDDADDEDSRVAAVVVGVMAVVVVALAEWETDALPIEDDDGDDADGGESTTSADAVAAPGVSGGPCGDATGGGGSGGP
uniref:Uncharacterized protein n=1 Tax=Anopheles atroparvus TaxID=41427 RepID=A0A182IQS0_ANOAO